MGVYVKREREMQAGAFAEMSPGGSGGRQRVGEDDKRVWRLFVKGDFAWQSRRGRQDNPALAAQKAKDEISVLAEVEAAVASDRLDLR
jgi:hypothetical protein